MKKCLKTFNDYQLSNKIINMAIILVIAISYIFVISVIFSSLEINYYLIIPMLVFLTSSSFFCTDGENKNMKRYILFYIIFLILFFLLPLLSKHDYFVSLFSYTVCMIPAILLTTEAVKHEGLTSFYSRVKDGYRIKKEINDMKKEYKETGVKNNINKYSEELEIEKYKLLSSLEEDFNKEKILLENLEKDLRKEREVILNKKENLENNLNATKTKIKKRITGFEKYYLQGVQKDIEKELDSINEELNNKEKEIEDTMDNNIILHKTFISETSQINSDYQIRHEKNQNIINKSLKFYTNKNELVIEGEN